MDAREELKDLYRKYWQYMIEKDADRLRKLMAGDYYLLHTGDLSFCACTPERT